MERRTIIIDGKYETWVRSEHYCLHCGQKTTWYKDKTPGLVPIICTECEAEYMISALITWNKDSSNRAYKLRKDLSKCEDVSGTMTE